MVSVPYFGQLSTQTAFKNQLDSVIADFNGGWTRSKGFPYASPDPQITCYGSIPANTFYMLAFEMAYPTIPIHAKKQITKAIP